MARTATLHVLELRSPVFTLPCDVGTKKPTVSLVGHLLPVHDISSLTPQWPAAEGCHEHAARANRAQDDWGRKRVKRAQTCIPGPANRPRSLIAAFALAPVAAPAAAPPTAPPSKSANAPCALRPSRPIPSLPSSSPARSRSAGTVAGQPSSARPGRGQGTVRAGQS